MKTTYLYLILFISISFLFACSSAQQKDIQDKELHDKIIQLQCSDSIQVTEIEHIAFVRNLRKNDGALFIGGKRYHISKRQENEYILDSENKLYFKIQLDAVSKSSYGGITKAPIMKITRLCHYCF